jgi:HSP20 family protein
MDPLEDTFRSLLRPWRFEQVDAPPRIRLDVAEQNGAYAVRAEIPGARKEDIDVRIEGNLVTISAEMKKEWDDRKEGRVVFEFEPRTAKAPAKVAAKKAPAKKTAG